MTIFFVFCQPINLLIQEIAIIRPHPPPRPPTVDGTKKPTWTRVFPESGSDSRKWPVRINSKSVAVDLAFLKMSKSFQVGCSRFNMLYPESGSKVTIQWGHVTRTADGMPPGTGWPNVRICRSRRVKKNPYLGLFSFGVLLLYMNRSAIICPIDCRSFRND